MSKLHILCHIPRKGYIKIAQIYGQDIFVYLKGDDPEMDEYYIARVIDFLKHAFHFNGPEEKKDE